MCLVEVEKSPKPVASCAAPVMPGSVVHTDSPLVHAARQGVMEFLLSNHPLDCPVCDQGGECDLQDQSMRYGSDRGRFHEIVGKRAVENKDFGPIIKTEMNRCIHCTRCVRFANDVAGVEEFGTTGRGNDMQIGTYVQRMVNSELSGNIIDLCPVGALLSKPYAFTARPWELKNTESIDVMDGLGSNVRIDSRGLHVMRVQPRVNDDINEEWISDKTRYAYDGLRYQRLTQPLIKSSEEGRFLPASWPDAMAAIKDGLARSGAKGDEIQSVVGALTDSETVMALKDLTNALGSDNTALDLPNGHVPPAHGVDVRSNYLLNASVAGIEDADVILLVGTNPKQEAAVLNSRIRKSWLRKPLTIGLIGDKVDLTYEYEHLGSDLKALQSLTSARSAFGKALKNAQAPLIILGSTLTDHPDAQHIYQIVKKLGSTYKNLMTDTWQGISTLQRHASRAATYDLNFVPSANASTTVPKFVYLVNADEFAPSKISENAFVVYQGHHGDAGAAVADVVLPGVAYTEKGSTWINTE